MKKILLLPLDERPCNYRYPQMLPQAGYELILPPEEMMGDKKTPADTDRIRGWLLEHVAEAGACILSMDTLIYGGIVPSRLHHEETETLLARAKTVEELKARNPEMKLYLFQLIMRCPDYSLSDEEPDYYDAYGKELHLYGRFSHLEMLGRLTEEEKSRFDLLKARIPAEVLQDFTGRRKKNLEVLMHDLEYVKKGIADYFIVPQDDAAVYGFTSMDQLKVRTYLKENILHTRTAMYPSADDTGLTLLARAVNELSDIHPRVFIHYASTKAEAVVPWFEDRALGETLKYHILSAGGQQVYSLPEADIVLAVNMGSGMYHETDPEYVTAYDIERNLAEFSAFIRYALEQGKVVAVGDVATCNGSDPELFRILYGEGLLMRLHAYAGWNTSSNTLGTAISAAMHYLIGRDEQGRKNFLLHRCYEDMGYMVYARKYVTDCVLPGLGLNYFHTDGKDGKAASAVRESLLSFMREEFPALSEQVSEVRVTMPWRRMFEADIRLRMKEEFYAES